MREDNAVATEVAAWLKHHDVKETVTSDRFIGCPHEEGIDYPMGRTCPNCPFDAADGSPPSRAASSRAE